MRDTTRFKKRPNKHSQEEFDMVVKANLLEFLNQLNIISLETWDEAINPVEEVLGNIVLSRSLIEGSL